MNFGVARFGLLGLENLMLGIEKSVKFGTLLCDLRDNVVSCGWR